MIKLKKLLKEGSPGFTKRKFGDPLPTFKDVMGKHRINKLKEHWWDDLSDKAQKAYIDKHGEAPGSAGDSKPEKSASDSKPEKKKWDDGPDTDKSWGVFLRGGSIGDSGGTTLPESGGIVLKSTFDSQDDAKAYAKRRNKRLSSGEKKHYGMRYLVRDLDKKRSQLQRH